MSRGSSPPASKASAPAGREGWRIHALPEWVRAKKAGRRCPETRMHAVKVEIAEHRHQEDHADDDQQDDHCPPAMRLGPCDIGGQANPSPYVRAFCRHRPIRFPQPAQDARDSQHAARSAERRVGKGWVSTGRSRWTSVNLNKKNKTQSNEND